MEAAPAPWIGALLGATTGGHGGRGGFDRNEQGRSPSDQFDGREGLSDDYG
jgi:hypothetical protein